MNDLVVAEKTCTRCGELKSLSDFYRNRRASDGRTSWCKACVLETTRERDARQRAVDPEAFKARNRASVQRHRSTPEGREAARKHSARRVAALKQLVENHRDEFDRIMALLHYEEAAS